jgi:hypothetical protein
MDMLPKLILSAVALLMTAAALLWAVWHDGYDAGSDAVMTEWQAERAEQARQRSADLIQARRREIDLEIKLTQLRGEHRETVNRITADRDAAVRELRRRPERPAGYLPAANQAAGAVAGPSCGADQLYREDAAAALGIAADADTVRASLTECRSAYDAARASVQQP